MPPASYIYIYTIKGGAFREGTTLNDSGHRRGPDEGGGLARRVPRPESHMVSIYYINIFIIPGGVG